MVGKKVVLNIVSGAEGFNFNVEYMLLVNNGSGIVVYGIPAGLTASCYATKSKTN